MTEKAEETIHEKAAKEKADSRNPKNIKAVTQLFQRDVASDPSGAGLSSVAQGRESPSEKEQLHHSVPGGIRGADAGVPNRGFLPKQSF